MERFQRDEYGMHVLWRKLLQPAAPRSLVLIKIVFKLEKNKTKKSRPGHSDSDFFHTARRGRGRASVIASAAVVTNCFFLPTFV